MTEPGAFWVRKFWEEKLTTERWSDERLDRLANAVEANTTNIARLANIAELHSQNFDILIQEIRGLRAENRRILSHLFGEQQSE